MPQSDPAHDAAIEQGYLLIEAAQAHPDAAPLEALDEVATARGWNDVRVLLHFARSLAAGRDEAHLAAMSDTAALHGDPALIALSIAARATRATHHRRTSAGGESSASLLVQAVVRLDDAAPTVPVVHRVAALIEVACVAHELGFWELALEYYELTEQALAEDLGGRWADTVPAQLRVVALNKIDLALDWVSCLAAIGDWNAAAARARDILSAGDPSDSRWPATWIADLHCQRHLLGAFTGEHLPAAAAGVVTLGAAIAAARAGDTGRAATLAETVPEDPGTPLPTCTHLLRLGLAAQKPGTNPAAVRYGNELAVLRWNDRLDRMAGLRDAIAVERRRRDHEQLRQDLVVDELTGLANRRGYHAYLAAATSEREPAERSYAVMMIDVDRFKAVNDGFGHDVGDLVLERLGRIMGSHVRPNDLAARLGGDEFVIILADVRQGVPEARARQILAGVRDHTWEELAEGLKVTVSIGVHHGSRQSLPSLLSDADRSLYRAKSDGRGRVSGVKQG